MSKASVSVRFYRHIPADAAPDECWIWQGATTQGGYGVMKNDGRLAYAHRVSYELHVAPIPEGMHIDHLCRQRACINPAHLEAVSQAENNRRAVAVRDNRKPYCKRGHKLIGEGYQNRKCRPCAHIRYKARLLQP